MTIFYLPSTAWLSTTAARVLSWWRHCRWHDNNTLTSDHTTNQRHTQNNANYMEVFLPRISWWWCYPSDTMAPCGLNHDELYHGLEDIPCTGRGRMREGKRRLEYWKPVLTRASQRQHTMVWARLWWRWSVLSIPWHGVSHSCALGKERNTSLFIPRDQRRPDYAWLWVCYRRYRKTRWNPNELLAICSFVTTRRGPTRRSHMAATIPRARISFCACTSLKPSRHISIMH